MFLCYNSQNIDILGDCANFGGYVGDPSILQICPVEEIWQLLGRSICAGRRGNHIRDGVLPVIRLTEH